MNKFKRLIAITTMLFGVMALGSCGNSSTGDFPQSPTTLTVGLECNYTPFNWTEIKETDSNISIDGKANQYADGYDIQIAKKIANLEGMTIVIKQLSWSSLIPSLQNGEINCVIAGMTDTAEREESIDFTDEYYRSELALVILKENNEYLDKVCTEDEFKALIDGKHIESQESTVTNDLIDIFSTKYGAIHDKAVSTFANAALDVSSGTTYAMTAELPVAKSIVASNSKLSLLRIDQTILGEDAAQLGVSIGVAKGNLPLKKIINNALGQISKDERETTMEQAITNSTNAVENDPEQTNSQMNSFEKINYLLTNYWQTFLYGLLSTLILAVVGSIVGLIIGIFIALGKGIKVSVDDNFVIKFFKYLLKGICQIYSVVLRGTPMMVQALIFKFACSAGGLNWSTILPGVPIFDGWLICGLIVITLNTGAYMGEDIRAGLNGLDAGQKEAAQSLGMSKFKSFVLVILPQCLRNCLPTLANEYIINVKDSSVLNVISVTELFLSVSIATSKNYFMVEGYVIIALIYLILTLIATGIFKIITKKIDHKSIMPRFFRHPTNINKENA